MTPDRTGERVWLYLGEPVASQAATMCVAAEFNPTAESAARRVRDRADACGVSLDGYRAVEFEVSGLPNERGEYPLRQAGGAS